MSLLSFRRHPSRYLGNVKPQYLGQALKLLFDAINVRDWLADIIADPRSFLLRTSFSKFLPKLGSDNNSVSVVMATRNNAMTVERSIRSILNQTHGTIELIVIDDASTDGSSKTIADLASVDTRIIYRKNSERLGTGLSRNIGMSLATGKYLTFQDGDDFSLPERIERQLEALRQYPDKKLCLCNYVRVDQEENRLIINNMRVRKCVISMLFPRVEALDSIGYFLNETVGEDAEYYERLKIAFDKNSEILVFGTLYEALFSANSSLFGDAIIEQRYGNSVRYKRTEEAEHRWNSTLERLEKIRSGELDIYVPFSYSVKQPT
jgi:glycosyltransferase involved in cell wall biosynthesis